MSSDIIPVLENGINAYLITPTETIDVIKFAQTVEDAANALFRAVKSDSAKRVFVVTDSGVEPRRSSVEALQKAGFTDIESIDTLSIKVSSCIFNLPLNCAIGEPVVVNITKDSTSVNMPEVVLIEKCKKGWQIIDTNDQYIAMTNEHPYVCHTVFPKTCIGIGGNMKLPSSDKMAFNSKETDPKFKEKFIRNRFNKGNLSGYEVLPYFSFPLGLSFNADTYMTVLKDRVPPFTISEEVDVGDAESVKAYGFIYSATEMVPIIKIFNFKSKAHRIVSLEVNVDKTLLPQVSLKTASTYEPPEKNTPVIYRVKCVQNNYVLDTFYPQRTKSEGHFETSEAVIAHIAKSVPITAIADIYFVYSLENTLIELRSFRTACQKAGFPAVKYISDESVNLSVVLDIAKVSVKENEIVGIVSSKHSYAVGRDGKYLKLLERNNLSDPEAKQLSKVNRYVIDNLNSNFTKMDLEYLRGKYTSFPVHVGPKVVQLKPYWTKYFWSLTNKTDFGGNLFNNFGDFEFAIDDSGIRDGINTRFKRIPYVATALYQVQHSTDLTICIERGYQVMEDVAEFQTKLGMVVELTVNVKSVCDITVEMKPFITGAYKRSAPKIVELPLPDEELKSSSSESKDSDKVGEKKKKKKTKTVKTETAQSENSSTVQKCNLSSTPPSANLTFTSDNRVLIEADNTYTGTKEILAYVRLQVGKPPQTGKVPFEALKKHPNSVFYDITRLFATDFDPDHPDPAWHFKTSRDADGKVIVSTPKATTYPLVLLGVVIQSTLLYIREHTKSEITSLGLKLPQGSTVSDTELSEVAKRVGVELVLLPF